MLWFYGQKYKFWYISCELILMIRYIVNHIITKVSIHPMYLDMAKSSNIYVIYFSVTNPIDVIKIRMQLDNELAQHRGNLSGALGSRYYKGFLRGAIKIATDEGVRGLYKGYQYLLFKKYIFDSDTCNGIISILCMFYVFIFFMLAGKSMYLFFSNIITINKVNPAPKGLSTTFYSLLVNMHDNMAYYYLYKVSFLLFHAFSIKVLNSFQWWFVKYTSLSSFDITLNSKLWTFENIISLSCD